MGIIEYTWTPTTSSVEKKNRKYELAYVIMAIYRELENCQDEKFKKNLMDILLRVL